MPAQFIRLIACVLSTACLCNATLLHISLDTSQLIGHPAQPFYIEFQLNDGSGSSDANNTAILDNFTYGGGSAGLAGSISNTGGSSGSLTTSVTLRDSDFFNQFFQQFTPGATLGFNLRISNAVDAGPQPDQFSFAILDCSLTEIPTTSPANALVSVDIMSRLSIQSFAGSPSGQLGCTAGPGIPLPPASVTEIPEPHTASLTALTFSGLLLALHRNRKKKEPEHFRIPAGV